MHKLSSLLVLLFISVSALADTTVSDSPAMHWRMVFEPLVSNDQRFFFGKPFTTRREGYGRFYSYHLTTRFTAIAFKEDTLSGIGIAYDLGKNFLVRGGYSKDDIVATSFLGAHVSGRSTIIQIEKSF